MVKVEQAGTPDGDFRPHEFTLPEKVGIFSTIATVWAPHLTPYEICLLSWLAANTIARGRRSGCYSLPQLVDGVPRSDGSGLWTAGTGMTLATVRRTVASARTKGVIETSAEKRGTRFTLVLTWNPTTGTAEESNVVALNLPRAARRTQPQPIPHFEQAADEVCGGALTEQGGCSQRAGGHAHREHPSKETLYDRETYKGKEPGIAAPRRAATLPEVRKRVRPGSTVPSQTDERSAPGNVEPSPHCAAPPPAEIVRFQPRENVLDAIASAGVKRAERLRELRTRKDAFAYEATWRAAWVDIYPGRPCVAWTIKCGGMIKKAVARWPESALGSVHAFLEWTVGNWDVVRTTKLAKLKTPVPTQPDAEFVARFISAFQEAWADKEELRWRGTLPGTRQAVIALMRREGISEDVALARVMAKQASEKDRAAIERIAAKAKFDRDVAIMAAENARRATRFTAANPHPRAHENVKPPINMIPGEPEWKPFDPVFFDESKL